MPQKTDSELVRLTRAGNKKAFGDLITRYLPMIRRIATDMVGSSEIGQELAQEAMLQAYLSLNNLRDDGLFRSWLCGITFNVCRGYLRDLKRAEASRGEMVLMAAPDPPRVAEEREQQRTIREAIADLSPENQAVLQRFYYEQWSLQEIASDLSISVVAVKGRLHKGRRRLRERLQPLYPQFENALPRKQRKKGMVKVTVSGVYMQQEEGKPAQHFVMLADEGERRLRIWVGQFEAWAISFGLEKAATERPMTMDLMVNLLRETDTTLEEVHIASLKDETFYAVMRVSIGGSSREMDARPSDAIALALRTNSPIFVSQEILDQAEKNIPTEAAPDGTPLTGLVSQSYAVRMAPISTDAEAIRSMAETILRQAIEEGASEIAFGKGPNQPSVHVLYRVGNVYFDAMTVSHTVLQPLTECFIQMALRPSSPGHVLVEHAGKIVDAHVITVPAEVGMGTLILLKELPPVMA